MCNYNDIWGLIEVAPYWNVNWVDSPNINKYANIEVAPYWNVNCEDKERPLTDEA